MAAKTKVAILGGGCGAMAAAFKLTGPGHRERYDVTVYQLGWRLGGKCASGRDEKNSQRILEHGLHMLLGFYEEAFALIRDCYGEWQPGPTSVFQSFDDAFAKQKQVTLQEQVAERGQTVWKPWNITVPVLDGTPGDPQGAATLTGLLSSLLHVLARVHLRVQVTRRIGGIADAVRRPLVAFLAEAQLRTGVAWNRPGSSSLKALHRARGLPPDHTRVYPALFAAILKDVEFAAAEIEKLEELVDEDLRRDLLLLRIGYAMVRGFVADVLLYNGDFSRINGQEFRTWLMGHGARAGDVWSPPIKALYDLGFAYIEGDATNPSNAQAAAGVALYVSLLIAVGCRGAVLWKMNAGAGDTLFTPLFEVLRARGVRFEFFHRVDELHLSSDQTTVDKIRITRQVELKSGYEPLREIRVPYDGGPGTLRCWPSEPLWDQIVDGPAIEKKLRSEGLSLESFWCHESAGSVELERGRDFDLVILGISLGGLPDVCPELVKARPSWQQMVNGIPTIQTQSLQLWLKPQVWDLGWHFGPTVSISYVEPFDAWGEMSHLLPAESWAIGNQPGSIEYFCGAMPTSTTPPSEQLGSFPLQQKQQVISNAQQFLSVAIGSLWPAAANPGGGLREDLVVARYSRANIDPSERYVLSVPGSIALRLAPEASGFANLYLAGDWLAVRVSSGSVEAAMSAGIRTALAIQGLDHAPV